MIDWLSDQLKRLLIVASDIVNLIDPFDEFDRVQYPKYFEYLWEKAKKFEDDARMYFYWSGRSIWCATTTPTAVPGMQNPINIGDQCLWHGVWTALWAIKYSVTKDIGDLSTLHDCFQGLMAHQTPKGEVTKRLIRGVDVLGNVTDDVSNDQASGHLAGIYFMWKYGDDTCRDGAKVLIKGLADELLANNHCLVNMFGKPTTYGALEQGWKTDPLRLTLLLAIYKAAGAMTGELVYIDTYNSLVSKHNAILRYAKVRLLWVDKDYDTHRAAIHYTILCDLETDSTLHRSYFKGLERVWRIARKSANPWIFYLVRRQGSLPQQELDRVLKHLTEMTLEDKSFNLEKINSANRQQWADEGMRFFSWGGHIRSSQPLPRWKVGSQDFFWQRTMYAVDDWIGNKQPDTRHSGLDFLISYWGLRSLNLIGSKQ